MRLEASSLNKPVRSMTVSEQVYNKIKSAILNGELTPGERIVQEDLTEQLRVSRTPVREALQRLKSEGLVTIKPFYGAMVFQVSIKELSEIYDIRISIERYAIQKAFPLLTDTDIQELDKLNSMVREKTSDHLGLMDYDREFHYLLCHKGVCEYVNQLLNGLWNQCDPYKSLYISNPDNAQIMISEHEAIVKCLKKHDMRGVDRAVTRHLDDVVDKISAEREKQLQNS